MEFQETIDGARASFGRSCERLNALLSSTPDDKLNWAPSVTARNAIQVAAHAALAVHDINEMLAGRVFAMPSSAEADAFFREREKPYDSREQVQDLLKKFSDEYNSFVDGLTPDTLNRTVPLPFGMGEAPLAMALTFQSLHMNEHVAQMSYIQTIYGDRIWH